MKRECLVKSGLVECDEYRWVEYDARGYALGTVCDNCRTDKLSKYRPEVLSDACYDADEPFEPDDY